MRKHLFIIFQFVFAVVAQAQFPELSLGYKIEVQTIDSIHNKLAQAETNTSRIDLLNSLARSYFQINEDDSLAYYSNQALQLSQKANYLRGIVVARLWLVEWLLRTGNYPGAIEFALQNLRQAEQMKDTLLMFWTIRGLSGTYATVNNPAMVLHYTMRNMQLVHSGYFKNEKDLKFYSLFGYLNIRGNAYARLNRLDSALYYRKLAHESALYLNNNDILGLTASNLAAQYRDAKDYDSAFYYYQVAMAFAKNAGVRTDRVSFIYLGLARIFELKSEQDSALYYGKLSLNTARGVPFSELVTVSFLSDLYEKEGKIDSAYKYLTIAGVLKDSLFSDQKMKQVQSFEFNERLHEQQVEQQRKEAQQQYENRLKIYSLACGLMMVLLLAYFLYRNNRQKQKTNLVLYRKNEEIQNALAELKSTQSQLIQSEKMASLGELTAGIAHEIQNPLNFVNNFSEINKEMIAELKEEIVKGNYDEVKLIANDIEENEEKISHHGKRADAIVKGMLQHSRTSTGAKESTDINKLADEYLRLAYHGMRAKDKSFNAEIRTDFDENIGKINIVPQDIGRVLLNIINNAFYAVNEKFTANRSPLTADYKPTVSVQTKKINGKVEIIVSDNGNGIPRNIIDKIFQPFFTTKPTGQGTGLGLSLAYDIVKAHGGEIKVETREGEGSVFVIQLPCNP